MSRHVLAMALAMISLVMAPDAAAQSLLQIQNVEALTADVETTFADAKGVEQSVQGRFYRSRNGRIRQDSPIGSMISDPNAGTVTLINTFTKEATVITVGTGRSIPADARPPSGLEAAGQVTVEGHPVTKTIANIADRSQEVWTATDIGFVVFVKVSTQELSTTKTFKNIVVGEPDPAVFELPKDYKITTKIGPLEAPGALPAPPLPPTRLPGALQ
jgi:hypothetical protein